MMPSENKYCYFKLMKSVADFGKTSQVILMRAKKFIKLLGVRVPVIELTLSLIHI